MFVISHLTHERSATEDARNILPRVTTHVTASQDMERQMPVIQNVSKTTWIKPVPVRVEA